MNKSVTVVTNGCTVTVLPLIQQCSQRTCHSTVDVTLISHILMIRMYFTFENKLQLLHYKYIQYLYNPPISFYRTLSILKQGLVGDIVITDQDINVMTGLRRVDSLAARCLLSRGRNKRAMVSRQKQEYQRQSRDVNNTRQGSRSQAQVQSSKVRQSRVKHRDGRKNNAQNVSQGKTRLRTG